MHQGSALSPLLFVTVMAALSRELRVALPWELLYAYDMAVIAETEDEKITISERAVKWCVCVCVLSLIHISEPTRPY